MKIIISHDVDHLFSKDHWFRDMIYPKLWIRSTINLLKKEISWSEWKLRCMSCFKKNRHCIESVMEFDKNHGVCSTFFFGMAQGLGMSYYPREAKNIIREVCSKGFNVGIHGIAYNNMPDMQKEYEEFKQLMKFAPKGIRMHYVRFDESTFINEMKIGYAYDTTEFEKCNKGTVKNPYKVGTMWEFPLVLMDTYLPNNLDEAKKYTLNRLLECKEKKLQYVTILFHDYQFCDAYEMMKKWYIWLIKYLGQSEEYSFISYEDAIKELVMN